MVRSLKQQDTDEKRLSMEAPDLDSISVTESWLDGSVLLSSGPPHVRRHSWRPRCGKRAKARQNRDHYGRCADGNGMACRLAGTASEWCLNMMTTLLDTFSEGSCDAHQIPPHCYRSGMQQLSRFDENESASDTETTNHIECGSAQVAGTSYSNEPRPPFEATPMEVSASTSIADARYKNGDNDSDGSNAAFAIACNLAQAEKLDEFRLMDKQDSSALRYSLRGKFVMKVVKPEGISMGMSLE